MFQPVTEKEARTFILLSISAALGGWNLAFKYGVAREIPFDIMLTIWAASTAAMLASLFWPREDSIISWWHRFVLATPSFWFLVAWMDLNMVRFSIADEIAFGVSLMILFVCVPYTVILLLSITNRELFELKTPHLRVGLVLIILFVYGIAFLVGSNHTVFLTCDEFEVAGDIVPTDCLVAPPE